MQELKLAKEKGSRRDNVDRLRSFRGRYELASAAEVFQRREACTLCTMASSTLHLSRRSQEELSATEVSLEISCTSSEERKLEDLEWFSQAGFLTFSCSPYSRNNSPTRPKEKTGTAKLHYWTRWPETKTDDQWSPIRYRPWNAVREDISRCSSSHSCNRSSSSGYLPTRVLDISNYSRGMIKLVEPGSGLPDRRYVAVSYCWGKSNTFTTTQSTIGDRKRGFSVADMPLTLRDAVAITHDLGLRYVWIDALCIVQDSEEDWLRESARMTSVYANAWITIVAAGARDSDEGFIALSKPLPEPLQLPVKAHTNEYAALEKSIVFETEMPLQNEPLFSRAWPLQEWELSPRRLVFRHFRIDFECLDSPQRQAMADDSENYYWPESLMLGTLLGREGCGFADEVWHALVHNYSVRDLTNADDKLPAMEGLAQRFRVLHGGRCGRYLAGLWEGSLPQDLAWIPIPSARKERNGGRLTAPSWSWASREGRLIFDDAVEPIVAEPLLAETTLASATNPFGRVLGGRIVIRGPHLRSDGTDRVTVARYPRDDGTEGPDNIRVEYMYGREAATIVYDDDGPEGMDCVFDKQHLLVICGRANEANRLMHGIVLLETGEQGVFRRIGYFTGERDFRDVLVDAPRREYTII
ncbi:hypothetical protein CPLU01_10630 [Colletotrichum plurivorum]|uniref:Heterokaryon incompatibility domain-containing protein n=1 Tax=Colletotrichum plurivorum TaxID=2175906 RepID=A0A8H6K4T2_9PEZI|nr:hypothetical protein CPLU01_10630 [Colletotrichum plurivorum]